MMMSSTREKRANAGNRMARLLENEEEDEFYSTMYGGFTEEADDAEYSSEEEESEDTDSDISIDENDEPVSDQEEETTSKRKHRVVTKAYKEPPKVKKEVKKEVKTSTTQHIPDFKPPIIEKKTMRESTVQKSAETKQRSREMEKLKTRNQKKKSIENYGLTQEELLDEAKITEQQNLKSLEIFQRLELEKKKTKSIKRTYVGPVIRYHSMTMPLIEELQGDEQSTSETSEAPKKYSRSFITFTDENILKEYFPHTRQKPVPRSVCPVSGLTARYFDPLTKTPYANAHCFRVIREAYYSQLEKKVDPKMPLAAKWLEWRKQNKGKHVGKVIKPST